jgi:hypothetical protein
VVAQLVGTPRQVHPSSEELRRLTDRLEEARPGLLQSDLYYGGRVPSLLEARERLRESRLSALVGLGINWSALAVDALAERLHPEGFRLPGASHADHALAESWRAAGGADAAPLVVLDALVYGRAYLLTWARPDGSPLVTAESPLSCTVAPGGASALKRWRDEDGFARALHMGPTAIRRLRSAHPVPGEDLGAITGWETLEVVPNPLGRLPLVPVLVRGRLADSEGASVLSKGLRDLQDLLNLLTVHLVVASEAASQPRRWVTGLEVPLGPDGEPVDPFAEAGRMYLAEPPDARFGSFDAADLSGLLEAIKSVTEHLTALASVPPHLAIGASSGQQVSAESVRAAESSLVAKVRRIALSMGAGFAGAMRNVLAVDGLEPAGAERLETTWADPQADTIGQQADALVKLAPYVPVPALLREVMCWSPEQVAAAGLEAPA